MVGAPQTIKTDAGEDLVVLTRHDYDVLLARAGDAEAEDKVAGQIAVAAKTAAQASKVQPLAAGVWDELEEAKNALLARRLLLLRKVRGLTQKQLADASGVEQSFISVIETGAKVGSRLTHERLAQVLAVDYETLVGAIHPRSSPDPS